MTIASKFNDEILRIWKREHVTATLVPSQYPVNHFQEGVRLLVLGMNPSFGEAWIQDQISNGLGLGQANAHLVAKEVYGWDPIGGPHNPEHLLKIEAHAFKEYRKYFNAIKKFSEEVGCVDSYTHFDLFHSRMTDQRTFKKTLFEGGILRDSAMKQIDLTRATLLQIRPKAVVIANAEASRMAVDYLKLQYVDNQRTQCVMPGLHNTCFFLSGMLSGGAMDEFSHRRLVADVSAYLSESVET